MRETIIFHREWQCFLCRLSDAELGQWTRAMVQLMADGTPPQGLDRAVDLAVYAAYERIRRDWQKLDKRMANLVQNRPAKSAPKSKAEAASETSAPDECANSAPAAPSTGANAPKTNSDFSASDECANSAPAPSVSIPAPGEISFAKTTEPGANTSPAQQALTPGKSQKPTPGVSAATPAKSESAPGANAAPASVAPLLALAKAHFGPLPPLARQDLTAAVQRFGPQATRIILENCIDNRARHWAYVRTALARAEVQGIVGRQEAQTDRLRRSGAITDRPVPSGNNILLRAIGRPLRLKRSD